MRQARSTKAVRTIPKGAYECGTTSDELMNGDYRDSLHPGLDLQENGRKPVTEKNQAKEARRNRKDSKRLPPAMQLSVSVQSIWLKSGRQPD